MRSFTLGLILTATIAGCATLTVSSHIERTAHFGSYLTYDWGPPDNLPVGDPRLDNNSFLRDYIQGTVERAMAAKGYELAIIGEPDLLVHYHANVSQRFDVNGADEPYGFCYSDCSTRVVDFEQGTLVVDIIDARTNRLVWRGWSQDTMTGVIDNQQRLEERIFEGVLQMMQLLPAGGTAVP
jgi:hypothetical protein